MKFNHVRPSLLCGLSQAHVSKMSLNNEGMLMGTQNSSFFFFFFFLVQKQKDYQTRTVKFEVKDVVMETLICNMFVVFFSFENIYDLCVCASRGELSRIIITS